MLEKAIIDAEALREAAVKNAESLVLEKFSTQIKDAVEILLEQDDPAAMMADPAAAAPMAEAPLEEEEESSVMEHLPNAAMVKEDEQIEIPLDALMREIKSVTQELKFNGDMIMDEDLDLEEGVDEDKLVDDTEKPGAEDRDVDESIELDEQTLADIVEQLTVDIVPESSGWQGRPAAEFEISEKELLALEQDSRVREEREAMQKTIKRLKLAQESLKKDNDSLKGSMKQTKTLFLEMKSVIETLKEKLDSSSLTNAKLLYQNKALNSDSLNERQKQKLVEAVSNADTIEEAKVIFETLQSTVGSTSRKRRPQSLGEAVEKSSSMILSSSRSKSSTRQKQDPTIDRWKFLAGIKD
tara:strand:- start:2732 stop:3796 length:1065 start_codon:yes stop_codon:yes gene_type:complete